MQVYYPWLCVCFRHVTMRLVDCVWCKPTFENCKSYCILWQHFPKVRSWLITAKLMGSASQCKRIWHVWHRCKSCISGLTRCWHYLPSWTKMSFADMQAEDEMVFNELGLKWQVTGQHYRNHEMITYTNRVQKSWVNHVYPFERLIIYKNKSQPRKRHIHYCKADFRD